MDFASWLMIGILGGAFLFGIWFMLMRSDDRELRTMSLQRRDAKRKGAPDFSQAHDEFSKKLAEVEDYLNTKRRNERALLIAKEEAKKEVEEEIARKALEEERASKERTLSKGAAAAWSAGIRTSAPSRARPCTSTESRSFYVIRSVLGISHGSGEQMEW